MDVLHDRCAGLDIGKKDLKACLRTPSSTRRSRRQEIRTFATTTNALLELRDWLVDQKVTLVVLEATGDYWRGAYYLLEDTLNVILVNAAHAKGLPGRKTDVSDCAWLAQLGECGLLKASFVPPEPIRHLRDLTRYRTTLTVERTREAQRLEKELEDAGIKISSVATDILGVSGRAMLTALVDGQDDAQVMAEMARGRMRTKIPALVQALTSAGIQRSGKRRHGNRWLGGALGTAAMAAGHTRESTYLGARYARLVPRLGKQKTIVAVEHSILTAFRHMLTDNVDYHDLGGDYFTKQDPERTMRSPTFSGQ